MDLWPAQKRALIEAAIMGGLFAPISVGGGKTLVCCLLPTMLSAQRTVIFTKASLINDAIQELEKYRPHFHIPDNIQWISYGILSHAKSSAMLEKISPDLIIADECHYLKSTDATRTRRFLRYMYKHPDTKFCALSGTITKRNLSDFGYLADLALGENSFMPRKHQLVCEWGEALDNHGGPRRPAGALRQLCRPGESLRRGFRRRMVDTQGVIYTDKSPIDIPLYIEELQIRRSDSVQKALQTLHKSWCRPDGEELSTALEFAKVTRELKLGGFYKWCWPDDKPDIEWLAARSKYRSALRRFLLYRSKENRDSPALVEQAMVEGRLTPLEGWAEWLLVRDRPLPPVKWVWVCDSTLNMCGRFARDNTCLVWTDVVAFGRELARRIDAPWYGGGNKAGKELIYETGDRTVVASIAAHATGRNLQAFNHNLIAAGVPTGIVWQQLLGRTHRPGQKSKNVTATVLSEYTSDIAKAKRDAHFIEAITGNVQKLLHAARR